MAQGIPRDKDEVMEILKPYFQLGCAINRACAYAGIPPTTVETWLKADDDLRAKVTAWQNEISAKARANWRLKISQQDYGASKDWLEANEKEEFSKQTNVDHTTKGESINALDNVSPEARERMRLIYEEEMRKKVTGKQDN